MKVKFFHFLYIKVTSLGRAQFFVHWNPIHYSFMFDVGPNHVKDERAYFYFFLVRLKKKQRLFHLDYYTKTDQIFSILDYFWQRFHFFFGQPELNWISRLLKSNCVCLYQCRPLLSCTSVQSAPNTMSIASTMNNKVYNWKMCTFILKIKNVKGLSYCAPDLLISQMITQQLRKVEW